MEKKIGLGILIMICVSLAIPMAIADVDISILSTEDVNALVEITSDGGYIDIIYNGDDLRQQLMDNDAAIRSFMTYTWYERNYHDLLEDHEYQSEAQWNFTNYRFEVTLDELTGLYSILGMYRLGERQLMAYTSGNTTIILEIAKNTQAIKLLSIETDASLVEVYGVISGIEESITELQLLSLVDEEIKASLDATNIELDELRTQLEAEIDEVTLLSRERFEGSQMMIRSMMAIFAGMLLLIIVALAMPQKATLKKKKKILVKPPPGLALDEE